MNWFYVRVAAASLVLFFLASAAFSQSETSPQLSGAEKAINEQVWFPFVKAYNSLDDQLFMDIHTEDVIRVSLDGKRILVGVEYAKQNQRSFGYMKEVGGERNISFSFKNRLHTDSLAYEVGYYKVVTTMPGKEERTFYGKFHVTLKKQQESWKIYIDSDSNENGTIDEAVFLSGTPLK